MLGGLAGYPPKSEDKYIEKVFKWSEVHLSEVTFYKNHTLTVLLSIPLNKLPVWRMRMRFFLTWRLALPIQAASRLPPAAAAEVAAA